MPSNNRKKLIEAVTALVEDQHGGDWRKCFDKYDTDRDGRINADEVHQLLAEAGIGNWWTRENWVKGVMKAMDTSADGKISWVEFLAQFENGNGGEHTGENDVP